MNKNPFPELNKVCEEEYFFFRKTEYKIIKYQKDSIFSRVKLKKKRIFLRVYPVYIQF
jgi:hypothetical protein